MKIIEPCMRCSILLVVAVCATMAAPAQKENNITGFDPISLPIQQQNVGSVVFLADTISLDRLKNTDFLKSFEAKPANNLYIKIIMGNTLTNYQHLIKPDLKVEQLNKGNFQFSFYVDGRLIYLENLNRGAGLASNKNSLTVIGIPLISNRGEDSWGRFLWYRFMLKGGDDALNTGKHILKIEVRPYINAPDPLSGEIIASGNLIFNVPPASAERMGIQPIAPGSGWELSNDAYDQQKIRDLNGLIAQDKFKEITSIVVIKNGKLLIEEYFNGSGRDSLHDPRSVGKTFASAILGIAIKDGFIKNENETLGRFYDLRKFDNYSAKKEGISLKNLLTMSSVFDADDNDSESPGNEENMYPTDNWVKFALDLPVDSNKIAGKQWNYFTGGAVIIGDILNQSVPGGLEKYASLKLFGPLGISRYLWKYTPQNVPNTAGGLEMRSLDYAKFGQLYKNGGTWNGNQILSRDWVKKSFSKQIALPKEIVGAGYYGFLFWNKTYVVNNKVYETWYCSGNGGNKIFIFADQPLVIIITATAYNTPYAHPQVDKIMEKYILPALLK